MRHDPPPHLWDAQEAAKKAQAIVTGLTLGAPATRLLHGAGLCRPSARPGEDVRSRSSSTPPYARYMELKADEVYQAGLGLDPDERAVVAHRLLASLHPADGDAQLEVDAAWRDEIGSRVDDILNGKAELSTLEQTRSRARALLDDLRK